MNSKETNLPGKETLCQTCVYGPGGHGEDICLARTPIISCSMSSAMVCSKYRDVLSGYEKPARPITND